MSKLMYDHLPPGSVQLLGDVLHLEGEHHEEGCKSHPTCPFRVKSRAGTSSNGSKDADWSTARYVS